MGSLTPRKRIRKGSVIPTLAISVVGLYAFVALAVDLGMLAVSRTHCQNGADVAALAGCRTLNNKPGVVNNDLPLAVANAQARVDRERPPVRELRELADPEDRGRAVPVQPDRPASSRSRPGPT